MAVSLALHLQAAYAGPAWQVYVFKPLTTTLIIFMAATAWARTRGHPWLRRYGAFVCAGLACSLAGDVLLLVPEWFVPGLAAFLVAHVLYIGAFSQPGGLRGSWGLAAPFAAYLAGLSTVLLPRAVTLSVPLGIYGLVLTFMAWQAAERWRRLRTSAAASAACGAVLFVISDSALAIDRFVMRFELATLVVMTTYIAAQWLIARSVDDR